MENNQNYQANSESYERVKPAIKKPLLLLNSFFLSIGGTIFIGAFVGPILAGLFGVLFGAAGVLVGILSIPVIFIIIWLIVYKLTKKSLMKTEYKFYSNRVEYYDGFLVKNRKTINYDRISNLGQRTGIIEGWFRLGTIFIDTAGYSPKGHELSMPYLENADQLYDKISALTNKKQ